MCNWEERLCIDISGYSTALSHTRDTFTELRDVRCRPVRGLSAAIPYCRKFASSNVCSESMRLRIESIVFGSLYVDTNSSTPYTDATKVRAKKHTANQSWEKVEVSFIAGERALYSTCRKSSNAIICKSIQTIKYRPRKKKNITRPLDAAKKEELFFGKKKDESQNEVPSVFNESSQQLKSRLNSESLDYNPYHNNNNSSRHPSHHNPPELLLLSNTMVKTTFYRAYTFRLVLQPHPMSLVPQSLLHSMTMNESVTLRNMKAPFRTIPLLPPQQTPKISSFEDVPPHWTD
ncbi:unnamed protein product [Lepeophtheirus salmonis]|uniref:(salmon louse) hypothetical protein n=1 Tax=Lepeophtheirus salmonis TaxID=72036 RepID=A0A7R8CLS5_LEPSM|nr:unnamed protein product [Lepeophtheirus salmonis]CAF2860718.1 unnamed protein product [Lepeophtheirus salmonis]